ncbi:MAG: carbon storage regulator [Hungatella sp.]
MLILQRKKNQSITIGDNIKITITEIGSDQIKIAIDAPRSIPIARTELLEAADANKEAASLSSEALNNLARAFHANVSP